jgi:hypothetical protein
MIPMKTMQRLVAGCLFLVLALTACQTTPKPIQVEKTSAPSEATAAVEAYPAQVQATPQVAATSEAYPAPQQVEPAAATATPDSYPAPTRPQPTLTPQGYPAPPTLAPMVFPESDSGYATIKGLLILSDPLNAALVENDSVYLLPIPAGQGLVNPEFDEETAIRIVVDSRTGDFRFLNVSPGSYAIAAFTTSGRMSVRTFETNETVLLLVDEDDIDTVIDLGRLRVP